MDATLIGVDLGLVLAIVYIVEPNLPYYLWLRLGESFINIRLQIYRRLFELRFWYDKQCLRPGPVGRFLREQQLRSIQRKYSDLFKDQP
jgi:hypothetical protein